MKFIKLSKNGHELKAYLAFVRENADQYPAEAWAFALASWHYDARDPRCPHDSWVQSIAINETGQGERQEHRSVDIVVRLLGAYHDGSIELTYKDVSRYELGFPGPAKRLRGHGDWIFDEVLPIGDHRVSHEIEFDAGSRWLIESSDITYRWHPK